MMKKVLIIIIVALLFGGIGWLVLRLVSGNSNSSQAVLKVVSTPPTTIFLNNENIGKTPFEDKIDEGEYTIKLIPESTVDSVVSWEGKVKLLPNLLTYINRELGDSELTSGGEELKLEKISGRNAEIAIISTPDGSTVTVSGEEKGKTPLAMNDLDPGNYEITVSASGFASRTVKVKTTNGFRLTAAFQLVLTGERDDVSVLPSPSPSPVLDKDTEASPSAGPKQSPSASTKAQASLPPKPYIMILDTPTGFLRVREEPSTASGKEVGRVEPGQSYALLDEENGWYKIEYVEGEEGWISSQYAEKFE